MRLRVAISHVVMSDQLDFRLHLRKMRYLLCPVYDRLALERTQQKTTVISAVYSSYAIALA